jgi:CheY-like chemotaxis protein
MKPIELLVVDDNAAEAYLVLYAVEDSPRPIRLYRAKDAVEGLKMLSERAFDLVILDLNLPGPLSGYYLLQQCVPTGIPVVMFSGSSNGEDAKRALELGAREFVRKPVGPEAYRHAVLTMIEKWVLGTGKKTAGV